MKWAACLLTALCVVLAEDAEPRDKRQSPLGVTQQQQFALARPPTAHQQLGPQLIARAPGPQGPPLTFHLLQQQGYRQEGPVSPTPLLTVRPTQPPPPVTRSRPPQHLSPTAGPRPQQSSPVTRRPQQQQQHQQQRGRLTVTRDELVDELPENEELEEDKPDRLTELLPLSKFDCSGRGTGYYADEQLDCEVFHYCQAGARHSWICPEGFSFHQVHLICMPPGGDNICKKSSQFHFVNEYLYRPINAEEAQTKPNVTLRYADRYYPENYDADDEPLAFIPQSPQRQRLPAPPAQRPRPTQGPLVLARPQPLVRLVPQSQQQPQSQLSRNQVFHSPEEVNIPLQHRRPVAQQRSQKPFGGEEDDDYYDDHPAYRQG